ncbi:EamA family transporter RarD [Oceanibium sediminis]|uniref:EamA family transporter RarD n=1 Tax=Oceanibium sediminis TaxID=2026339 RepID=UPI000DD3FB73|nr:EamA family transporter RarD [Oceanibium sediminis]
MSDSLKGVGAMVLCCSLWGVSALYFAALRHVPVGEVLSHRMLWSGLFLSAVVALSPRLRRELPELFTRRTGTRIIASAALITCNWGLYVWAVQIGRATDASLGYYIFPLLAAFLGYLLFGERFTRWQKLAIGCALLAVVILTLGLGRLPWIAVALASTFALYGVVKKTLKVSSFLSVTAEIWLVSPFAAAYLAWRWGGGKLVAGSLPDMGMLMLSVVFTGLPLIFLSYASQRVNYATLGLLQYMNPTLQAAVAVLLLHEPFGPVQAVAFGLIWLGVALFASDVLVQRRRRAAVIAPG